MRSLGAATCKRDLPSSRVALHFGSGPDNAPLPRFRQSERRGRRFHFAVSVFTEVRDCTDAVSFYGRSFLRHAVARTETRLHTSFPRVLVRKTRRRLGPSFYLNAT